MSKIYVDEIAPKTVGSQVVVPEFVPRSGQIIETLAGLCDGTDVTVQSGTYTIPSVTAAQALTNSYADVTGSVISYKPPTGTTRVIYSYSFNTYWDDTHAISHYKLYLDGTEVTKARTNNNGQYQEHNVTLEWVFTIGTADSTKGSVASWDSLKEIKLQARQYDTGNTVNLHGSVYWDGTGSNQFRMPHLKIQAVA